MTPVSHRRDTVSEYDPGRTATDAGADDITAPASAAVLCSARNAARTAAPLLLGFLSYFLPQLLTQSQQELTIAGIPIII